MSHRKPIVRNWMREAYKAGDKANIPAEALALLEAEAQAPKAEPAKEEKKK